jgi:small subunit ribosomal protein S35
MFEDIALDVRHHRFRRKLRFPQEWKMTEERKKMLSDLRMQQMRTDSESLRIDGLGMIAAAHGRLSAPAPEARKQRVEVPIRAEIRMPELKRKTGLRKGMR